MIGMTGQEVKRFLRKYRISENQFSIMAGIHRNSLRRFIHQGGTLWMDTADKIRLTMIRIEQDRQRVSGEEVPEHRTAPEDVPQLIKP
jgi:hypothetical protein